MAAETRQLSDRVELTKALYKTAVLLIRLFESFRTIGLNRKSQLGPVNEDVIQAAHVTATCPSGLINFGVTLVTHRRFPSLSVASFS